MLSCPRCGRGNDESRRFCSKCGYQLFGGPTVQRRTAQKTGWRAWWARIWSTQDRAARRAYRRSLPPFYRWRRVSIVLLLIGAMIAAGKATNLEPSTWARDRWSDAFYANRVVDVAARSVVITPASATKGSDPIRLIDNTGDAWTTRWDAKKAARRCPKKPTIELTFPPARVRQLIIIPGIPDEKERRTEFRATEVRFAFGDDDPCAAPPQPVTGVYEACAKDRATHCAIETDSRTAVTRVRIVVSGSEAPSGKRVKKRLSVAEIKIRERER